MIILNHENSPKRNLLLTIYLSLTLIFGVYLLKTDFSTAITNPNFDNTFLFLIGLADIIFTILLLNWKKWGFYGLLFTSLTIATYNLIIGNGIFVSIIGFLGFVIIYFLLLIKKNGKTGWENLK